MKKLIFLILLVIALPVIALIKPGLLGLSSLEKVAPVISLENGQDAGTIDVKISDVESGLDSLLITAEQGGQVTELIKKQYELPVKEDLINFSYMKLKEGPVKIKAIATDAGFWGNTTQAEKDVLVDYSPPKLRLLSLQHVGAQGGTEFVIYETEDSNLADHGVEVAGTLYPGFKVEEASLDAKPVARTYISLFALPLGYEATGAPAQLVAKDTAGNVTKIPVYFRLEKKPQADFHMNLKEEFLASKAGELYPGYLRMASEEEKAKNQKPADVPENLWKFRLINRNFRDLLDAELKKIFETNSRPRQWKETFIKPMSSATSSTFGEKRTYAFNGIDGGYSVHNGLDLASVNNDKVHSSNDGVVVLSKDFGIYGNAVVIDHGLGLFTLYGHLASVDVKEGDKVTRGQELGRSGQTGLAGGDHLHFEFRLRNTPVTPIEWWDSKWIKDNIDGKIAELSPQ